MPIVNQFGDVLDRLGDFLAGCRCVCLSWAFLEESLACLEGGLKSGWGWLGDGVKACRRRSGGILQVSWGPLRRP